MTKTNVLRPAPVVSNLQPQSPQSPLPTVPLNKPWRSMIKKSVDELHDELKAITAALQPVLPPSLAPGDMFISPHYIYDKDAQHREGERIETFCVKSRTRTTVNIYPIGSDPNTSQRRVTVAAFKPFWIHSKARMISPFDQQRLADLQTELYRAEERCALSFKRANDVYVLWNTASETRQDRDFPGFLIEIYDGNGKMIERLRLVSDSDKVGEIDSYDAVERMVRAYAVAFLNRENVKNGSKFQINYCLEID